MAFAADLVASIKANDGAQVVYNKAFAAQTAKELVDAIFSPGTIDLSPHLTGFTTLSAILVVAHDSDFTFTLDTTNFSPRRYRTLLLEVADTGLQTLSITLTAQSRVQLIGIGV